MYKKDEAGALALTKDTTAIKVIEATRVVANIYESRGAEGVKQSRSKNPYREWIQGKNKASGARLGNSNSADDVATKVIENQHFKVYPNPSTGIFYYNYVTDTEELADAQLEVYDMRGQLIISGSLNSSNANGMIDLSSMSNGMYFVKIATATKILFNSKINVVK